MVTEERLLSSQLKKSNLLLFFLLFRRSTSKVSLLTQLFIYGILYIESEVNFMVELVSIGCVLGLLLFLFLFYKILDFFMSRHYDKKNKKELITYSEFYRAYNEYRSKITEQWRLENDQKEIQTKIEKEQSIMNCFPFGADYEMHSKKISELRYSYLCKQGSIDIAKAERKDLASKLNSISNKPEHANQNYK